MEQAADSGQLASKGCVSHLAKVLRTDELNKCIGCFSCMLICAATNCRDHSIRKSCIHIRTSGGLHAKFAADICQACREPHCAEVCPAGALSRRKGGGVLLDTHKCTGCRRCEKACTVSAIGFDEDTRRPLICRHCGVCAQFCPHGCLSFRSVPD